jgi:hypothetical protein
MPINYFNLPDDVLQLIAEYANNEKTRFIKCFKDIRHLARLRAGTGEFFCKLPHKEKVSTLFHNEVYYYFTVNGKRFMFVECAKRLELLKLYSDPFKYFQFEWAESSPYLKIPYLENYDPYHEEQMIEIGHGFEPTEEGIWLIQSAFESRSLEDLYEVLSVSRLLDFQLGNNNISLSEILGFAHAIHIGCGFILKDEIEEVDELPELHFSGEHYYEIIGEQDNDSFQYDTDSEDYSEESESEVEE